MDWLNNKNETSALKSPAAFAESKSCHNFAVCLFVPACVCVEICLLSRTLSG